MDKVKEIKSKLDKISVDEVSLDDNKYVACFSVINQYTWGITGQNIYIYIIAGGDRKGFNTKEEARDAYKEEKIEDKHHFKTTITEETGGYGNIGWHYHTPPKIITIKKLKELCRNGDYYYTHGTKVYI